MIFEYKIVDNKYNMDKKIFKKIQSNILHNITKIKVGLKHYI